MGFKKKIILPIMISSLLWAPINTYAEDYTVRSGDSLYTIAKANGTTIDALKSLNRLSNDVIYVGQVLRLREEYFEYIVKSGDTLWLIAQKLGTDVYSIKSINSLTNDTIYIGQKLKVDSRYVYTVKAGDSLWIISSKFSTTVQALKQLNSLTSDEIMVGQQLIIPKSSTQTDETYKQQTAKQLLPLATITYTVKSGDSVSSVAGKFGITKESLIKYNYMSSNDWLNAGQIIAINGYAPRNYTVVPGMDSEPLRVGNLVDWYLEGQYIIKRNDALVIADVQTGNRFNAIMIGGYNHIDIEPMSAADTETMFKVFGGKWQWSPRAVVIYKDGMNIAASLSGMPHSFETISGNNMSGHCDLYLLNSKPHGSSVSSDYVAQHNQMVLKAAGK